MTKGLKLVLIIFSCIITGIAFFIAIGNNSNTNEDDSYILGKDIIKSIKTIIGDRNLNSSSTNPINGMATIKMEYTSDTVREDLIEYTYYLQTDGEFSLTSIMDLTVSSSTISFKKNSVDPGKIISITIDYDSTSYAITIQKS